MFDPSREKLPPLKVRVSPSGCDHEATIGTKDKPYRHINAALYQPKLAPGRKLIVEIEDGDYPEGVHLIHNCCLMARTNNVYLRQITISGNSVAYCRNINIVPSLGRDPIIRNDQGIVILHHCYVLEAVPNPKRGKTINTLIKLSETFHGVATDVIIPSLFSSSPA